MKWFVVLGVATVCVGQTVVNGSRTVKGTLAVSGATSAVDFSQAASTAPATSGTSLPATCTAGNVYFKTDATPGQNLYFCTAANTWSQMTGGNVTSVGLVLPNTFTVTGSPVTGAGTLSASYANQSPNTVLAGPGSGGAGTPAFRALGQADLPLTIPTCAKYTVTTGGGNWTVNGSNAGALAASTSQTITLASNAIPARGQITALRVKHSTSFSGTGITALTVSLGDGTTSNIYAPAFDVYQATGNTVFYDDGGAFASTAAQHSLSATLTSTGGNLSAISAGSVDIWACTRQLP
jgi:hypothetical protein